MSSSTPPEFADFQKALVSREQTGYYPWEEVSTDVLRNRAVREAAMRRIAFPDGSDFNKEIEATKEFALAARLVKKTYKLGTPAYHKLMTSPDGHVGGLLNWAQPDWDLVLFCAKLLRYIALCGQYEIRAFTPEQRLARDVREKRHKALMEKWPPVKDPIAA